MYDRLRLLFYRLRWEAAPWSFPMSKVRMPFGKYKGDLLGDIPSSYLIWFVDQHGPADDPLLKRAMAMELLTRLMPHTRVDPSRIAGANSRPASDPHGVFEERAGRRVTTDQKPTPPHSDAGIRTADAKSLMLDIINAGYRTLAKKHHPDMGGNPQVMHQLTVCADALRAGVRQL